MKASFRFLFCFASILMSVALFAQSPSQSVNAFELNGSVGITMEPLANSFGKKLVYGGRFAPFWQLGNTPIYAGPDLGFSTVIRKKHTYHVNVGGFNKKFTLRVRTNLTSLRGVLRLKPKTDFPIQPYLDVFAGGLYLSTIKKLRDFNGETTDRKTFTDEFCLGIRYECWHTNSTRR